MSIDEASLGRVGVILKVFSSGPCAVERTFASGNRDL